MRLLKTQTHLSDEKLSDKWKSQTEIRAFQDWQIIYSVQVNYGKTADEFSKILGVKASKIKTIIQSYNKDGENWCTYGNWEEEEKLDVYFR